MHDDEPARTGTASTDAASVALEVAAVVVAVGGDEPRVLTVWPGRGQPDALPSARLAEHHATVEVAVRDLVREQTRQPLGYVEQLYTFGDAARSAGRMERLLTVAYVALVREAPPRGVLEAAWLNWYRYLPWEDWRRGRPRVLDAIEERLRLWTARGRSDAERETREERARIAFALGERRWDEERVLERYELLYGARLVPEAWVDRGQAPPAEVTALPATAMAGDHRRILATAIGRLRGKIKYRPVVFELMPPAFSLRQLRLAVEALAGIRLHAQNFRRLVEQEGLIEETGEVATTGGRPARLFRFRREVLLERPAPGVRLGRRRSIGA